jgi:hypothetical protein
MDRFLVAAVWVGRNHLPRFGDWLVVFCASTLLVFLGVAFGREYLPPGKDSHEVGGPLIRGFVRWDGAYYRDIAQRGYSYRFGKQSTIHFMPLYPLVSKGVQRVTGLSVNPAMVVTSHLCFLGALLLLATYTERRYGAEAPAARSLAVLLLAFVRNRDDLWRLRPRIPPLHKLGLLLILEPVWGMYVPDTPAWWGKFLTPGKVLFNTHALGPIYFLLALFLVVLGGVRGRLNRYELTLCLGLLLVPYWMTAYDSAMVSMARYVSVIVPLYSYGAALLARAPALLVAVASGMGGLLPGNLRRFVCPGALAHLTC